MKTHYLLIIISLTLLIVSCKKSKKNNECEFNKIEFVGYDGKSTDIKKDKSVLECLQLEIKDDVVQITNKTKTINIKFTTSGENIIEEIDIKLADDLDESFNSLDEQEIELIEKEKTWEISIKSENESKFNGYLKLYKTSDGDYWKEQNGSEDLSIN